LTQYHAREILFQVKSGSLPLLLLLLLPLLGLCFSCRSSPPRGAPLFEDVAKQSGIDFWQYSGATGEFLLPEMVGSGAALIDYDNDGDMDVFLVQGYPTDPQGKAIVPVPAGWKPGNRLFRNNLNTPGKPGGKLTFTDVTESAGLGHAGQGMGVAAGDYDNDGYTDLYVTNYDHNILYHNNGNGIFTDVTATAGVASAGWSTSAAFIDYDRDGLLDLAVVHYVQFYPRPCYSPQGSRDYCGPQPFQGSVTQLYRNLGNGRFKDVTVETGLNAKKGPGLGILTGNFGTDGYPGFMVANDGAANHLWISQPRTASKRAQAEGSVVRHNQSSDRVFQEEGLTHGLAYASDGKARAGMGIAAGDIYGDGGEAVIVTNLPNESFTLFQRQPSGDFVDATGQSGLSHISLPYTGFGVGLLDTENRGLLDMFSANGGVRVLMSQQQTDPFPYRERKLLLRNLGKGKGFADVTASAGPALQPLEVSRAAVFGDVNNDGGVDILVTNNNGPARLLLNTVPNRGHWILVHLEGVRTNRSGYGSVVELVRKDGTSVKRWARGDGSYLAANDPRIHFGLGKSPDVDRIQVHWLAGTCEAWPQAAVDRIVNLREGTGQPCR
jgi:enediyne biosynthesis protein E4